MIFFYKRSKSNLNITFNRIFFFFIFFIIFIIFLIHLAHLGSRNSKINETNELKKVSNKLYRADITDKNNKYLVKTIKFYRYRN